MTIGFRSLGRVLPILASSANIESKHFARARGLTLDGKGEKLCRATRLVAGTRYSMPEVQGTCSLVLLLSKSRSYFSLTLVHR